MFLHCSKVSDFNSTTVYISVLITTLYLAFHVRDFTTWQIYRLWLNYNMVSSKYGVLGLTPPSTGYPKLADFLESARGPAVHFTIQSASHPTRFRDLQINAANSSNPSPVAPSDFPTVFPHEPSPPTFSYTTASAGRIVKAARLSPLHYFQNKAPVVPHLLELVQRRSQPSLHARRKWRRKRWCSLPTKARN